MKNLLALNLVLLLSLSVFAKTNVKSNYNSELAEASLIEGINSANNGLMVSSATMLGELKSNKAVVPLMNILRSSSNAAERISAAQALVKIGDARGVYAVKKAAEYDENQRVRDLCAKFYFQTLVKS